LPGAVAPRAGFFIEIVRVVFFRLLLPDCSPTSAKGAEFTAAAKAGAIAVGTFYFVDVVAIVLLFLVVRDKLRCLGTGPSSPRAGLVSQQRERTAI
jgi:hypothetical protein